jgi:hypothetical protein
MKKLTKKQMIIAGIIAAVLVLGGGAAVVMKLRAKPAAPKTEATKKKKITEAVNVIPVADRPYMQIKPDASNKHIYIVVDEVKKSATAMEYEIEYQTGSQLEGAFGTQELGQLPTSKDILLGSCSAGGACRYHTEVKGGTLLGRFTGTENYAVKSDWKYIENPKKETSISSTDAFFQLESPELAKQPIMIIFNSPGYPQKLGTVISDIYSLTAVNPLSGKGKLTMRAKEDAAGAKIMGWDGKTWKEFTSKVDGKNVTADVDLMEAYVVAKK